MVLSDSAFRSIAYHQYPPAIVRSRFTYTLKLVISTAVPAVGSVGNNMLDRATSDATQKATVVKNPKTF